MCTDWLMETYGEHGGPAGSKPLNTDKPEDVFSRKEDEEEEAGRRKKKTSKKATGYEKRSEFNRTLYG